MTDTQLSDLINAINTASQSQIAAVSLISSNDIMTSIGTYSTVLLGAFMGFVLAKGLCDAWVR